MSIETVQRLAESPDLLRRFLNAPLMRDFEIANRRICLRSNDENCLQILQEYEVEKKDTAPEFEGTLLLDKDLPGDISSPLFLENESVVLLSFGRGCFVVLHRFRKELFGFISPNIGPDILAGTVVPAIAELLSREATSV